jgi:aubergine-like protein
MNFFRPKLAVVIVKKKGNARFFAKMGSTSMVNPPPGTIIDHTVTNGKIIEFDIFFNKLKISFFS